MSANQVITNSDPYTKTSSCAFWIEKEDGSYKWQTTKTTKKFNQVLGEWLTESEEVSEQTPTELGLIREATVNILVLKEYPSMDELDGKIRVWFKIPATFKIPNTQGDNLYFRHSEGRLFLINCYPSMPQACEVGFTSCENYSYKEGKAVKLTIKQAQELAKTTKYVYSKQINGEYVTVV
ncbi:hypothetical protein GX831_00705 [bacterium]|jgi:hypothetical protein|nr:hypothetical protein [bacterium]